MRNPSRLKHQLVARLASACPATRQRLIQSYKPIESADIPWTPMTKPLEESKVVVVTTAGVHHSDQVPFDMTDPDGDPSFRMLRSESIVGDYKITHDYYDHRDAERDLNIVLPIQRLTELATAGFIGAVAGQHFSFMGHIVNRHIDTLLSQTAPEVARILKSNIVDVVLLTPG